MSKDDKDDGLWRRHGQLISFGYTMGGSFVAFGMLGMWLDDRYKMGSTYTLSGMALAFAFSMYELWKLTRWLNESDEPREPDTPHAPNDPTPDATDDPPDEPPAR